MIRNLRSIWSMFFYVFFCNIIKVNHILYCFIMPLHLIFFFLHTRSLLVLYAYASIESINCTFLSLLALIAILLMSSVNTLCLLLVNFCRDFHINLLSFMNFLWVSLRLSIPTLFFSSWPILFSS